MGEIESGPVFLVGDIGGTNTNLALVQKTGPGFSILVSKRYSTQDERSLIEPMERFLDWAKSKGFGSRPDSCCISGAGPVRNGSIRLTNAPWSISADEIQRRFAIPVRLINDFTAVSYAVVLLDPADPVQIRHMPHTDGSTPMPGQGVSLVVGAGTGLGVGYINRKDSHCEAFPSEGGHTELSCYDPLSRTFQAWMQDKLGFPPGAELAVSGQGIANIFDFVTSGDFSPALAQEGYSVGPGDFPGEPGETARAILSAEAADRPAAIASNAARDPFCLLAMEVFVNFYARKVSSLSAVFLPEGGIYLAGGISSKNEDFLLQGNRFMRAFEQNYAPHIREHLAHVPVMIVRDYSISLIGAANAAYQLSGGGDGT